MVLCIAQGANHGNLSQERKRMYIAVESIALEAFKENDEKEPPVLLPRGGVFEVVKKWTTTKTETGAPQSLYWIVFYGSDTRWLIAPQWYEVIEMDRKPQAIKDNPSKVAVGNAMYRLVRVDSYDEEPEKRESRKLDRKKLTEFLHANS